MISISPVTTCLPRRNFVHSYNLSNNSLSNTLQTTFISEPSRLSKLSNSPKIIRQKSNNFSLDRPEIYHSGRAFLFEQCFILCTQIDNRTERLGFHCEFIIRTNKLEVSRDTFAKEGDKHYRSKKVHSGNCFVVRSKSKGESKKLEHFFLAPDNESAEKWLSSLTSAMDVLNNFVTALGDPKAAFADKSKNMFFL